MFICYSIEKYRSTEVPPGYDRWYGLHGNSKYYNYTLNENGVLMHYGNEEKEYLTDVLVSINNMIYWNKNVSIKAFRTIDTKFFF